MSSVEFTSQWMPDLLGESFSHSTIDLGADPDGEGNVTATLVRYDLALAAQPRAVVLWVHGFSDYFFHRHVAERFAADNIATYGLDLRKCGRSLKFGQSAHYTTDLQVYDAELDAAVRAIARDTTAPIIVAAHSTGGLIAPLWLERRAATMLDPVVGLVLNSPWLQLDVDGLFPFRLSPALPAVDRLIDGIATLRPKSILPLPTSDLYGTSLWVQRGGEFDFRPGLKPLGGVGVRAGWLRAVRRGQRTLQRGLSLEMPVLQLRSTQSAPRGRMRDIDTDLILDVASMYRFGPMISSDFCDVPIAGARHDVFASQPHIREQAFTSVFEWLAAAQLA